jgi:hypothetical protein
MRGSCLCGSTEFQIDGDLPRIYQCHCSLCRKQGGSSSNAAIIVEARNLRWIAGQEDVSSYVKPTGFRSDLCDPLASSGSNINLIIPNTHIDPISASVPHRPRMPHFEGDIMKTQTGTGIYTNRPNGPLLVRS